MAGRHRLTNLNQLGIWNNSMKFTQYFIMKAENLGQVIID